MITLSDSMPEELWAVLEAAQEDFAWFLDKDKYAEQEALLTRARKRTGEA